MLWQKRHWHHSTAGTPLNLWSRCFNSQIFHCFDFQNLGEHLEEEEIEGLLDEADEGEGIIIYSEFCDIKNLNWAELNISHLPFHALHFMALVIFTVKADLQVNYMQFVSLILLTESVRLHTILITLESGMSFTSQKFSRRGRNYFEGLFQEVPCLTDFRSDTKRQRRRNVN